MYNPQPATVVRPAELKLLIQPAAAAVRAAELAAGQWRLQSPPGGWLLSLQTDRCSSDPTKLALVQRSVQPLPEHLRRQLQGAPARDDQRPTSTRAPPRAAT